MELSVVLKALGDETRLKIVKLLLKHNYCVRALARKLEISESAVSQHLKVLREAGLLKGEKKGYFMHYDVDRIILRELAAKFKELAEIEREVCNPDKSGCLPQEQKRCHIKKEEDKCSDKIKFSFLEGNGEERGNRGNGNCHCRKSEEIL